MQLGCQSAFRYAATVRRKIEPPELVAAVEEAIVRSYDDEQSQYVTMKRFGWAAMALGCLALILIIGDVNPYSSLVAGFAAVAGIAWFVSRAELEATRSQIAVLDKALAEQKLYVGGRNRDVYLTTDPYDNAWGDAMGAWLRKPSAPEHHSKTDKRPLDEQPSRE